MQKYLLFVVAAGCLYANNNLLPFPEESCCTSVLVKLLQTKVRNSLRPGLTDYCTDLFIPRVRDLPRDILQAWQHLDTLHKNPCAGLYYAARTSCPSHTCTFGNKNSLPCETFDCRTCTNTGPCCLLSQQVLLQAANTPLPFSPCQLLQRLWSTMSL